MSTFSLASEELRRLVAQPKDGVVGLADDLLALCRHHRLQIDWQASRCRLRSRGGEWEELTSLPIRKPAFRALLARFAALCNEHRPDSITPYGGQGECMDPADPLATFRVSLVNTADEQRLELATIPAAEPAARQERLKPLASEAG